jgi:teichoic acid transport system permease protein
MATYESEFNAPRHVYEPHKVGLPPMIPYVREAWRRREFLVEMSRTKLRSQHFATVFGMAWLIINPLLLAGVYFVLVDILRSGKRGPEFFAHLVGSLFAYYFIQQSANQSAKSVTGGGRLILNTAFPRVLLPLASVHTAFIRFLPTVPVYLVIHALSDAPWSWAMLWTIPIFGLLILLACGLAMLLSAAQVYFRDLRNFLPYTLRIWLYASPILYYAYEVPDRYEWVLKVNPLGPILSAWTDVLDLGQAPAVGDLVLGLAWGLAFVAVGGLFFVSREREFAVRL